MLDVTGVPPCIDTLSLADCAATGGILEFMVHYFWDIHPLFSKQSA